MGGHHDVLGLDPGADEAAVERAYRRRLKEAHPDHGGSQGEFRAVRRAYEALTDGDSPGPVRPSGATGADVRSRRPTATVEYLDYAAIDDGTPLADDCFDRARERGLDAPARGRFTVGPEETLLEAAERDGWDWPFACRGGACANCAVAVASGELDMPASHVLPDRLLDRGVRLSCVGRPATAALRVVYNLDGVPALEELRLPPDRFERARGAD
ncbi:MAG: 2Fe-2S iron-sulfur cluster-binding protein [Halobacteriales archaeon]